ncbi:MAG TPA: hypothetical protein VIK54_03110 [Acidimicrobiia bacterium]
MRSVVRILCVGFGGLAFAFLFSVGHARHADALSLSPSVQPVTAPVTNLVPPVTDTVTTIVAAPAETTPPVSIPPLVTDAVTPVEDALTPPVNVIAPVVAPAVAPVAPIINPVVAPIVDPAADTIAPVVDPGVATASASPVAVSPRGIVTTPSRRAATAPFRAQVVGPAATVAPRVVDIAIAPSSSVSLANCVNSTGAANSRCSASRSSKLPAQPSPPVPVLLIEPASSPALPTIDVATPAADGGRSFPGSLPGLLAVLLALVAAACLGAERLRYATARFGRRDISGL